MANYDRQILVPYLRDICSIEMLCRKLEQDIRKAKEEAEKYTDWANRKYVNPPQPKYYDEGIANARGGMWVFGIIAFVGLLVPLIGIFIFLFGLIGLLTGYLDYKDNVRKADESYAESMKAYKKKIDENKKYRESIPIWKEKARKWKEVELTRTKQLQDARKVRDNLYSVNIIPTRYRTIHAAYYLYDFFASGRETDLERTIQTMLLDEIVQRLDKIIAQNQEIIINQRMQLAWQEQRDRNDDDHHQNQMKRIAQMEQNQQRQIDYQNMIARNQQVTNFFLAADYLRKK